MDDFKNPPSCLVGVEIGSDILKNKKNPLPGKLPIKPQQRYPTAPRDPQGGNMVKSKKKYD